jgi:uncharacterized membrane protein YfcA
METQSIETLLALIVSFIAGLVDAVAGGGGLIQLPAILILFPNLAPALVLSTNKIPSFAGAAAAAWTFSRRMNLNYSLVAVCSFWALLSSALGAHMVSLVPAIYFRPLVASLLIFSVSVLLFGKFQGDRSEIKIFSWKVASIIGFMAGMYDGFFGPGTGTIIIALLASRLRLEFLSATAHAKLINLATNAGAIAYFILSGNVVYGLALPLALANILGGLVGSRLALHRGNGFVRKMVLAVALLVAAKLLVELVGGALALTSDSTHSPAPPPQLEVH